MPKMARDIQVNCFYEIISNGSSYFIIKIALYNKDRIIQHSDALHCLLACSETPLDANPLKGLMRFGDSPTMVLDAQ